MIGAVQLPRPGIEQRPFEGLRVWVNPLNGFTVVETHYTADPTRRGDWRLRASPKYGGLRSWRWRKEQEIDWDAQKGSLVFENWDPIEHVVRPFTLPEHWPKWIFFDPGWRNPTSIIWVAVDVDTPANQFGFRPVHVYREFYKARRSAETCALVVRDMSSKGVDEKGIEHFEWLEEIIIDPAAKQEHQSAASSGDNVNDVAETVLEKFTRKCEEIEFNVPITTGNNDKSIAIEEMIARLGRFWVNADGLPLYDTEDRYREPDEAELAEGAEFIAPTLFFHETVLDGAREMAKYRWRDWASNEVAERHNSPEAPIDKDDHTITNIIRCMNYLRDHRGEGNSDLADYTPRRRPGTWRGPDAEIEAHHRERAARFRKRTLRRRRAI